MQRTESQAVHGGDRPRAHREDVAQNAADAGGCALKRFDERRMIVGFDLVGDGQAVADVDDAGIFAGALQNGRSFRRKPPQMDARTLVAAVLAPHHAEDAEFRQVGSRFRMSTIFLVFAFREAVWRQEFVRDTMHFDRRHRASAFTIDSNISLPSALPRIASLRPIRMRHHAEHIPLLVHDSGNVVQRPFGFASGVICPFASA